METQTQPNGKKQNQAVAQKASTAVSADVMQFGAFGTENVITQDLRFPKLLLMQALSEWVNDPLVNARGGEIRESYEKTLLGGANKPVQVIPFFNLNVWKIKKKINGKFETVGYEDRTNTEARMDREFKHPDGADGLREKTLNLFCLIKGGNMQVPYLVGFTNYSFKHAAQSYLNKLQLLKAEKKSPAHVVWNLGVTTEKNDKGTFFVFTLDTAKTEDGKDIPNSYEEVKAAYEQYSTLSKSIQEGAKVDISDTNEDTVDAKPDNF